MFNKKRDLHKTFSTRKLVRGKCAKKPEHFGLIGGKSPFIENEAGTSAEKSKDGRCTSHDPIGTIRKKTGFKMS